MALVAGLALLAGCGSLPRPFEGRPGANAQRLVQPPPARLAVARPNGALLPDAAADSFAVDMAAALSAQDVPAIPDAARVGDWQLVLSAEMRNEGVVPFYAVIDNQGRQAGIAQGEPIPPAAWAEGRPETIRAAANSAAPSIASLLSRIEAARRASDPNSLLNRPARIHIPDVTGAPGDGNRQLARQMREQLPKLGLMLQDAASPADFTVAGQVVVVPTAGKQERVEIQWIVTNAAGDERGRLVQLNEVPAGSLNRYWGDVALAVAQEAAGGVKDVVLAQSGAVSGKALK